MKFCREKLVELRKATGLNQPEFAKASGITLNQIKKHETMKDFNIGLKTLYKYANFFGVDPSELFEFTGDEKIFAEINALKERVAELEKENQEYKMDAFRARSELASFERAYKILVDERNKRDK